MGLAAPPWIHNPPEDTERSRYAAMSPAERLECFIDACELGRAILEGRPDRGEILRKGAELSEESERTWRRLVAEARRARPSW